MQMGTSSNGCEKDDDEYGDEDNRHVENPTTRHLKYDKGTSKNPTEKHRKSDIEGVEIPTRGTSKI